MLISIVACGILVGGLRYYFWAHQPDPAILLNQKLAKVRPQMTQKEMEQIFTDPYGPPKPTGQHQYFVPPDFLVEVTYSHKGSPGDHKPATVDKFQILRRR